MNMGLDVINRYIKYENYSYDLLIDFLKRLSDQGYDNAKCALSVIYEKKLLGITEKSTRSPSHAQSRKRDFSTVSPLSISSSLFQPPIKRSRQVTTPCTSTQTLSLPTATAIHTYNRPDEPDKLSFRRDDLLIILEQPEPDWYLCELNDQQGLVPADKLRLDETPTVHQGGDHPKGFHI